MTDVLTTLINEARTPTEILETARVVDTKRRQGALDPMQGYHFLSRAVVIAMRNPSASHGIVVGAAAALDLQP